MSERTTKYKEVERHHTPDQVAELLGVNVKTVFRCIERGEIRPVCKFGHRTVRIPNSSVARFLEAHTI